jgi:polynucleotide 5'-hydroxyl-kinase GRC3/NOL9
MPLESRAEWERSLDQIVGQPGVVVVVGAADSGKTSFCAILANRAVRAGIPTAVVDCDMGQSEIGPPGTIGLGLVESEIASLADLKPRAMYFIGTTNPVQHLLPTITGCSLMTEKAKSLGRELIIVDTTGLVQGLLGRRLKTSKIQLLKPRHIVALQKGKETEHFLRFFDTWTDCTVHRLSPSPHVHVKSAAIRTQRRGVRFYEYFSDARIHQLSLAGLSTSGTWLKTGDALEPKFLKFAEGALDTAVFHGEIFPGGVYLVTGGDYNKRGVIQLQEQFKTSGLVIVSASKYVNLLVGLIDDHLELLALGIIKSIDFRAGTISILTPLKSVSPVKSISFGDLKVRPNGSEIARLRPGET